MILYVWKYTQTIDSTTASVSSYSFEKVAMIDNAVSVIWIKRFNSCGEFELYLPASAGLIALFSNGETFISKENDDSYLMSVENIKLDTNDVNGDFITVSGRSAECLIGRRIVYSQMTFTGTAENCIRNFIDRNMIRAGYPSTVYQRNQAYRNMPFLTLGNAQGYTETIEKQATWKNVLNVIIDICVAYDYGFKLEFTGTGFVFNLYKGVDRSVNQSQNTFVIFSPEFENLGNTSYSLDKTTYYNYVWVGGEGEGNARSAAGYWNKTQPESPIGMRLRELFVDARNTSSNNGEIPQNEYVELLHSEAMERCEAAKETKTFEGEILNINGYVYGVDYGLGDKVSIVNEYGITGTANVTEITEVDDENGYRLIPTLSEWSV